MSSPRFIVSCPSWRIVSCRSRANSAKTAWSAASCLMRTARTPRLRNVPLSRASSWMCCASGCSWCAISSSRQRPQEPAKSHFISRARSTEMQSSAEMNSCSTSLKSALFLFALPSSSYSRLARTKMLSICARCMPEQSRCKSLMRTRNCAIDMSSGLSSVEPRSEYMRKMILIVARCVRITRSTPSHCCSSLSPLSFACDTNTGLALRRTVSHRSGTSSLATKLRASSVLVKMCVYRLHSPRPLELNAATLKTYSLSGTRPSMLVAQREMPEKTTWKSNSASGASGST
mmetsp:Transcript_5500/g.14355  ORF Transcript_5500/g.14355 Transcript_5500/m.14355 type:complete len:289 (-) Transcript_5500:159-1025(-)